MPNINDTYIVILKRAHLEWGTHRYSLTRNRIYGEGYLQLPVQYARAFGIFNSNQAGANTVYTCDSVDGFLKNERLLASGSSQAGAIYSKQFQGHGNLRAIGQWYHHVHAQIGDRVQVTWTSPTHMLIERLP
jgi:hypothetical protein